MKQETLKHDFKSPFGGIDVSGAIGFSKALTEIVKYVQSEIAKNPGIRFIDSVKLLDVIIATYSEINVLVKEAEKDLQEAFKELTT